MEVVPYRIYRDARKKVKEIDRERETWGEMERGDESRGGKKFAESGDEVKEGRRRFPHDI